MDKANTALEVIRGLVRPGVTFSFVAASIIMHIIGSGDPKIDTITEMIVAFWFSERAVKKAISVVAQPSTPKEPNGV